MSKVKNWFISHWPSKRRLIQLYSALLFNANIKGYIKGNIFRGKTKSICVPGMNCYSCPGAIGACPLGSLQNALSGANKKAIYYVVGILLLYALILGRTICGFLCPFGLIQELLYKIKTFKLKKNKFTKVLSYLKYVLLFGLVLAVPIMYAKDGITVPAFCKYVCPSGTLEGAVLLLINSNNTPLLSMLGKLFTWKFLILIIIVVLAIFLYRPFCRFLCPIGAFYGLFAKFNILGVKVNKSKCTNCGICVSNCKVDISHVGDSECIHCGDCIDKCPVHAISWNGSKFVLPPNDIDTYEIRGAKPAKAEEITDNSVVSETPATKKNNKKKVISIVAGLTAGAVLVADLVYVNFIYKEEVISSNNVGETCNDFTYNTFQHEEYKFSVSKTSKKCNVIYFVNEVNESQIAEFEALQKEYDDLQVTVLFSYTSMMDASSYISLNYADSAVYYGFDDKEESVILSFMEEAAYPSSIVLYEGVIQNVNTTNVMESTAQEVKNSLVGLVVGNEVGNLLPTMVLEGNNNVGNIDISSYKGSYLILNFWGTWCGPCVQELPYFEQIYEEYKDQNVKVVAVHSGYLRDTAQDYITQHWPDYQVTFVMDEESETYYNMLGFKETYPITYIVDTEGVIYKKYIGSIPHQDDISQVYTVLKQDVEDLLSKDA